MDFESDEDRLNRISNEINNGQYRMKRADVVTVPQQYSAQGKFNPVDGNAHLVREIDSEGNVTNFDRSGNPVEPTFGERLSKIWNTVKSYAEENPEIEFPAQTLAEAIGNTITSTAGSVADSVKEMPLYRSVFLTDEERLADAEKIGTAIGINPQILADNQGLYENAKKIYDKQQAMEITGGQLFSVPTIQEMYPEVNLSDPVQAAIALKNAREVIESREAVQSGSIADGIKNEWNFIKNTWTKGYEAGEAGSEIASIWGQEDRGEISLDEAVEKINELEKKAELPENRGPAETILSETAMQIARNANSFPQALGEGVTYAATSAENILGIPKGTILKWMNTNMALPSFAKYLGNHVLNNPAAALAVNAKFAPSIFIGAFRDSYYDNYQRMRLATDAFGKHKYTKEEARRLAAGEASVQAAIEQKGVEIAFGPVFRILSKGPAAALISNAGAVKALLGAGKQAAARTAMKQAGVQFAKGAAAEIGEEGAQDLVSSIVENALGHEDNSFAEIIKSAGEAMLQAVPSVIGMMAPGAAVHGVGTYRGMKTISVQELKAAQEEIKRENESSLLSRLMELKKSSKLFQKSPESYRTTLQNQMNQAGMGTIYIDAQAAAQNEATHEALNNLVSSGAVTAKELNQAITTGKPLEVKSGKYMQTATPEMNEALSDYTTMDKGERTMHAIREERQRNQDLVDLVRSSQKEREAKAGKAILDKYFPDTSTEEGKEDRNTMVELLTGGLPDIKTNVKNALEAALKDWGDLTGVKDIQDYMKGREGVFDKTASEKGVDTVSLDRDTMIRISKNPGWYQDFYKSYGRAPNARELYDIAHRKMEDEVYYNLDKNDAEGMAEKEAIESAKRRVESLERVKDIVDKFDDKDIVAQSLLDPETYEQVYKPTVESLSKGNAAVNKSARDSALILSKMAENFHKNYGLPLKMAAVKVANDIGNNSGLKQMTRKEQSWVNSRLDQLKNYQRQSEREKELEKFKRSEPVTIERKDRGEYKGKPATEIPKLFRAKYPNGIEVETKIGTVKITARGIKNSLSHGMSQAKIDATFTLSDGLKNAAYMGSLPDKDGKPIINHFFAFKANYEGKPYIVVCRARETTTADNFYVHEIYLKEDIGKAEQSVSRDLANSRLSWGPALLYTSIIRQFLNGRNINSGNEYHQMAGELAKTANMKALKEAKRMLRSRKSMEEISKETGWSIGMDGRWRFYIPDRLDKIDTKKLADRLESDRTVYLMEIYENPKLYNAYPWLSYVQLEKGELKNALGYVNQGDDRTIYLTEDGIQKIRNDPKAASIIVHEIQHMIQGREGFAEGGGMNSNKEIGRIITEEHLDGWKLEQKYNRELALIHYLQAAIAWHLRPQSIMNSGDWYAFGSWSVPKNKKEREAYCLEVAERALEARRTDLIQQYGDKEHFNIALNGIGKLSDRELKNLERRMERRADKYRGEALAYRTGEDLQNIKDYDTKSKHWMYWNLAGEIEARSAEEKAKLELDKKRKQDTLDKLLKENPDAKDRIENLQKEISDIQAEIDKPVDKAKESSQFDGVPAPRDVIVYGNIPVEEARFRENYFQTAVPDLVVTHNTTEGKLEKTIQLGGFPMPSLGISKKGMKNRLEGFGEITLLGNRDMVDPRKSRNNDVFSRDAYTVRKPAVNYEEPSEKDQLAFYKKYKAVKDELGEKGIDAPDIDFSAYDGEQILNRFNRDPIVRYYYIKNVLGKDVPVKKITIHPEVRNKRFFDKYPEVLKALKSDKIREGDYSELDKATKPYFDHLQNLIDEKKGLIGLYTKRLRKMTTDGHINKEGAFMLWKWMDDYEEDVKKKSYDTVDKPAFQKDTDRLITETGIEKFNDYIQKEFESLYKEKYLWDKGKKYKFTLANIVKLMKKDRGADSEGAPGNYGFNSLLAYLSRKFTSIRDIKKNEGMLQPNEKELAQYKKTEAMYTDLLDEAAQLRGKYDESIDTDLAELIKDVRDGKTGDMHGFPENKEFMDHIQSLLKGIEKVTTDYFEAKPARAVSFSEFSGAVVPENTNPEIIRYLENQGIAVETYDPKVEGEQKVKTEELAEKLNVYFQGEKYLGAYDRANNAIEIFDGANQSTVIHEGAHMYLSMLEEYSALSPAELSQYFNGDEAKAAASLQKMGNDLRTIREWAAYTENHLKEYKGTGLEKEFTQYGKDIENGVEGAEERFMQERFARGFEKYLMDGSTPTKELRGVFRRFKSWLKDIYSAAKNLGNVKLTPEIKDIYDHMLATDREVEAWAAQRKLDSIDKALNVNASEAENLKKWSEEVKEKAKEIALSYYMKTMKSDALDSFKKSIDTPEAKNEFARKLAEKNPFFKIEQILHSGQLPTQSDRENFLKMNNYGSEKEFNEAVQMMGGTTEEQYRKHIGSEIQNFKDAMLTEEDVRAMAENVLESPEGLQKRANLEAALLEKRVNQYINEITTSQLKLKRASDKAKAAAEIRERLGLVTPEDKAEMGRQTERIAKNEEKISKLEDQVKNLREQLAKEKEKTKAESNEKASAQEEIKRLEGNLTAREKELEEERAKNQETSDTLKDTEASVADLSVQLSDMVEGLKESRKAMKADYKLMKDEAASTLGEESVSHATSWKWWENKARVANARAMKAASQNNWEESAYQKNVEAQCLVMARTAKDNIEEIKHDLHGGGKLTTAQYNEEGMDRYGILGIINRIGRKEKPVLMNDDARYFVQHLAYMAGMTKRDGEKPIDENGLSRDFDWHALGLELNPDLGIKDGKYDGFDVIPPWMKALFDSNTPMKFEDLKMNDYRAIVKAIKAVYKIGRREYEGNTLGASFEKAATDIQDEILTNWKQQKITPMDKELSATSLQRIGTKFHKLVRDITLPEIQIERLGEAAYKYIYIPIDKATAKRRQMKQDANRRFRSIFDIYSRKEWTRMRSKKEFQYGVDINGNKRMYTKEQVLAFALNMGTQSNRARLIETVGGNEASMLDFLDATLDKRDWEFVQRIWEHVGEYWGERNKIQNDLYGTPMGKVPGINFKLRSGQTIHGMYYPIKYDHKTSSRSNEYNANDIAAMDLQGISAFSLGMGSTKTRENGSGGQNLRLDLDVYVSHISEAIQHVAMREATVDVFKLLSRKEVVSTLERTIGTEATNELRQWVSDNWHSSIIEMNEWEKGINRFRHKFTFATMGYRVSTALLNVLNIFGMMDRMGTYNALKATADFYFGGGANKFANIKEQYQFIISKSTFMRERASTMDRDMTMGDRIQVDQNEWEWGSKLRHGKYGIDTINSGAFKIIALTDEMFSLPEWLATYKGALAKMQSENSKMTMEEMDQEAIRLADKAVRETFGSGEMKDQTSFMRKGGSFAGITTFFSYTNLVTNQFIRAGYALYDYKTVKPLLRATLFWWLLNAFFETCLRETWDDSDDPDKWKKKLLYTLASGGPLGGIPILRDMLPPTVNFIAIGGKKPLLDITPDIPALDSVKYFGKALQSFYKGDSIETGRNVTKGLTRVTEYTLPDTLVDGYWNFMRMISSDNYTVTDWIYKSMFDKPLKEKK